MKRVQVLRELNEGGVERGTLELNREFVKKGLIIMKNVKNVICIKWGTVYSSEGVNKLYGMVTRNSTYKVNLYILNNKV